MLSTAFLLLFTISYGFCTTSLLECMASQRDRFEASLLIRLRNQVNKVSSSDHFSFLCLPFLNGRMLNVDLHRFVSCLVCHSATVYQRREV